MTITFQLDGDGNETMDVQFSVLTAMLQFSRVVPGLTIEAHHICACGLCKNEEHIYRFEAGKQTTIQ